MKIKQDTKIAIFAFIALVLLLGYYFSDNVMLFFGQSGSPRLVATNNGNALAVTGAACTIQNNPYDRVEIQYTLQGEFNRLKNLISTCTSPDSVFSGEYTVDTVTPKGNTYRLGSYSRNNFITCGSTDSAGVIFNTVPNEHTDTNFNYVIKISGFYYKNKTSNTKIPFSWQDSVSVRCINQATDKCADGTAVKQCSATQQGKYCTDDAYLVDRAPQCPCNPGYTASGGECVKADDTNPPPPPQPSPSPSPSPNPNPNPQPSPSPTPTPSPSPSPTPSPTPQPTTQNDKALYTGLGMLAVVALVGYYFLTKKRGR